jgi:hypothetical protein
MGGIALLASLVYGKRLGWPWSPLWCPVKLMDMCVWLGCRAAGRSYSQRRGPVSSPHHGVPSHLSHALTVFCRPSSPTLSPSSAPAWNPLPSCPLYKGDLTIYIRSVSVLISVSTQTVLQRHYLHVVSYLHHIELYLEMRARAGRTNAKCSDHGTIVPMQNLTGEFYQLLIYFSL